MFEIGVTYNFNTKAPSVLGTTIKQAKLTGIADYNSAMKLINIDLQYRKIYPLLPPGTPNTPKSCIYYVFLSQLGETIVLANQWIDDTTIEVVDFINIQATVTSVSLTDITRIRDALNAMGYTSFEVKQL